MPERANSAHCRRHAAGCPGRSLHEATAVPRNHSRSFCPGGSSSPESRWRYAFSPLPRAGPGHPSTAARWHRWARGRGRLQAIDRAAFPPPCRAGPRAPYRRRPARTSPRPCARTSASPNTFAPRGSRPRPGPRQQASYAVDPRRPRAPNPDANRPSRARSRRYRYEP